MRSMVIRDFGGPEVFEEREWETPQPGPNQVLVKIHATSVNPVDFKLRQAGASAGINPPAILGYDVSGVVEDTGEAVTAFQPGDEVFYTPEISGKPGSYAEYHVADAGIVAHKPDGLSHDEAASLPLAGVTALDGLIYRGPVEVGQDVLVHGAGGVGSLAIQIAVAAGARVFATCSDYMVDIVGDYGAVPVNYKTENFVERVNEATHGTGVDVVLDTVGGNTMARSIPVIKEHARIVNIIGTTADFHTANFKNPTVELIFLERARSKLQRLRTLVERGQITPLVDSVMDLSEVADAHRRLESGGVTGKLVLRVSA